MCINSRVCLCCLWFLRTTKPDKSRKQLQYVFDIQGYFIRLHIVCMVVRNRQRSQFSIVIFVKSIQLFPASFSVTMMTHCSPLLTLSVPYTGQGEVCYSEQYNNILTYSSYYQYCSGKFIMILLLCCIHPPMLQTTTTHVLIMLPLPFVFFFSSPH